MSDLIPHHLHAPTQSLGRLVGSFFGPREAQRLPAPVAPRRSSADDDDAGVPELLRPAIQRYSARWEATRERHDKSIRKAKLIDVQLGCLRESLHVHLETGSALSQELSLLQATRKHVVELSDEAAAMKSAFVALEQLYASLANADSKRTDDLVRVESEHRRARHQHYLQLQQEMDKQYEELQRNSVHARAAHAERSFQQDLEIYRQRQQTQTRDRTTPGSLEERQGKRGQSAKKDIADVVLSVGDWGNALDPEDNFFSDDDDGDTADALSQTKAANQKAANVLEPDETAALASGINYNTAASGAKKGAPTPKHKHPPRQPPSLSNVRRHKQEPPSSGTGNSDFVILEDEDFV